MESVQDITQRAHEWFSARVPRRNEDRASTGKAWSVAIFNDGDYEQDLASLREAQRWLSDKWDAKLAGLDWSEEFGGWGLTREHADAVAAVEAEYDAPHHELLPITTQLVACVLRLMGTDDQKKRWVSGLARGDILCAQLFSEPSAGSDLAGLNTRATQTEDGWSITGQKVWSSGACRPRT